MKITIRCKSCQTQVETAGENEGKQISCPSCGHVIRIPLIPEELKKPKVAPAAVAAAATPVPPQATPRASKIVTVIGALLKRLRPWTRRAWQETWATTLAVGGASRRVGSYAWQSVGEKQAARCHHKAMLVLAGEMLRRQQGDSAIRKQLVDLDATARGVAGNKKAHKELQRSRRGLLLQLAEDGLRHPTEGVDTYKEKALAAERKLGQCRKSKARSKAAAVPPRGSRLRVAIGLGVVVLSLYAIGKWNNRQASLPMAEILASAPPIEIVGTTPGEWQDASVLPSLSTQGSYAAALAPSESPEAKKLTPEERGVLLVEWQAVCELLTGEKPQGLSGAVGSAIRVNAPLIGDGRIKTNASLRVVGVEVTGAKADEAMALLTKLPFLEELDLAKVDPDSLTDRGLQYLPTLRALKMLNLAGLKVSDEALGYVGRATGLTVLNLDDTRVTDTALASLANLRNLEVLGLRNTKITTAGLPHLGGLTRLRTLAIYPNPKIDPEGACKALSRLKLLDDAAYLIPQETTINTVPHFFRPNEGVGEATASKVPLRGSIVLRSIQGMSRFKTLSLSTVYDDDMPRLRSFPNLERLALSNCSISGNSLDNLHSLPELRYLELIGIPLDDEDLKHLVGTPRLTDLHVAWTHVTQQGVDWLEEKMPRLKVNVEKPLPVASPEFIQTVLMAASPAWNEHLECTCPKCLPNFERELTAWKVKLPKYDFSRGDEIVRTAQDRAALARRVALVEEARNEHADDKPSWDGHAR